MIGAANHQNGYLVFLFHMLKDFPPSSLHIVIELRQGFEGFINGKIVFILSYTQQFTHGLKHFAFQQQGFIQAHRWIQVPNTTLGKKILFLGKGSFYHLRRARHNGAAGRIQGFLHKRGYVG